MQPLVTWIHSVSHSVDEHSYLKSTSKEDRVWTKLFNKQATVEALKAGRDSHFVTWLQYNILLHYILYPFDMLYPFGPADRGLVVAR